MLSPDRSRRGSETDMSLAEYLEACRADPMCMPRRAERMLAAIGEPQMVDTSKDPRLGRIFMNRTIRVYPAFAEFYGMEETIEQIVCFFRHAAQGLEERKQILYLLGPGRRRQVVARRAAEAADGAGAVLRAEGRQRARPVYESPLGLFDPETMGADARRALRHPAPPPHRPDEPVGGQAAGRVRRRHPQVHGRQAATRRGCARSASPRPSRATRTTRTSPRWSARSTSASSRRFAQNDPDAYSYSGGLYRANQGMLEFVEMFKAPIKMLHPLLTATQEGNYIGTEDIGAIPFDGIILAHSNESRVADLQQQQEQRGLHRPHLRRSRCRTACASPKRRRSTRS